MCLFSPSVLTCDSSVVTFVTSSWISSGKGRMLPAAPSIATKIEYKKIMLINYHKFERVFLKNLLVAISVTESRSLSDVSASVFDAALFSAPAASA